MADSSIAADVEEAPTSIFTAHRKAQTLVIIGSILSLLVFTKGSAWMHIPQEPGFEGSLLGQKNWVLAYIAICLMLVISALIGTIIAGRSWVFAGLFTAVIGLGGLSERCGELHYVLFDAMTNKRSQSIFLRLAMEHCILMIPMALLWLYFWQRFDELRPGVTIDPEEEKPPTYSASGDATAVVIQIIVMLVLAALLVPTDKKKQALIGIFVAGAVSAALAESVSPTRNAAKWYWVGSLVVGLVGYFIAYSHPELWITGFAEGGLANLAHAMPLDLASAGIAGTLLGYWSAVDRPHVAFSFKTVPVLEETANHTAS